MITIAICDDDNYICSQIEKYILNYSKTKNIKFDIEVFYSGESLTNFIMKEHSFDLIFLDIELTIKLLGIDNQIFEYKKGYDLIKVNIKDILYFESKRKKIKIVTHSNEDYFYGSLENIKKSLPKSFIEPHGSFLINFDKIERITKDTVFMKDGLEIPLSQRNLKKIRSIMIEFEREKRNANI